MTARLEPYRVSAYNSARQSENKMHDDATARRFGFAGGLVPGVDVMAYMMHAPLTQWGLDFLGRGLIEARFVKPVYDGETATVTADSDGDHLAIAVESRGDVCATGRASLPREVPAVELGRYADVAPVATRPPVGAASFAVGSWLGTASERWDADRLRDYLREVRDGDPLFVRYAFVHPGILQRIMNRVLVDNVILGPWIHVGSRMQLLAPARGGDALAARAKVTGNYDKKGHRFVELDALIVANGKTPVAHCHHVAIVEPRAQAAA